MHNRRYRDKERSEPASVTPSASTASSAPTPTPAPVTTTPVRAITPSETKKSTSINLTVNPKSLTSANSTIKSTKITKKIDMGAASNFGRDELGINSPTHRNTHAEEDLFATSTTPTITSSGNQSDLDDLFKTCSTTNNFVSNPVSPQSNNVIKDDDFFNPREEESQEFGDFASAFSTSTEPSQPEKIAENDTKKNDFADFGSAFDAEQQISSNTINDPANLLFAINSTPNAQNTTSNSNLKVGDLLSDLDGLSLDVSVPTGKLITFSICLEPFLSLL